MVRIGNRVVLRCGFLGVEESEGGRFPAFLGDKKLECGNVPMGFSEETEGGRFLTNHENKRPIDRSSRRIQLDCESERGGNGEGED